MRRPLATCMSALFGYIMQSIFITRRANSGPMLGENDDSHIVYLYLFCNVYMSGGLYNMRTTWWGRGAFGSPWDLWSMCLCAQYTWLHEDILMTIQRHVMLKEMVGSGDFTMLLMTLMLVSYSQWVNVVG
eukprot:PhF_6_TR40014/c0_g1_i1/m.59382